MNGWNVQYRSYPPFGLSFSYYQDGYSFWQRYNADIGVINNAVVAGMDASPGSYSVVDRAGMLSSLCQPQ
jgi:hypothetical protein